MADGHEAVAAKLAAQAAEGTTRIDRLERRLDEQSAAVDSRIDGLGEAAKSFNAAIEAKVQGHQDRSAAARSAMEKDGINQLVALGKRVDAIHERQEKMDAAFGDRMLAVERRYDEAAVDRGNVVDGLGGRMEQFEKSLAAADRQLDDVQRRQDQIDQSEKERRAGGQNPDGVERAPFPWSGGKGHWSGEINLSEAVKVVLAAGGSVSFGGGR